MRGLYLTPAFERDFKRLSSDLQTLTLNHISLLQENIRDTRLNIKKLINVHPSTWRLRIGTYRVLFTYDKRNLYLLRFVERKDAYRGGQ